MENFHGKTAHLEWHNENFGQNRNFFKNFEISKNAPFGSRIRPWVDFDLRNWFPLVPGAETLKNEEKQANKKSTNEIKLFELGFSLPCQGSFGPELSYKSTIPS